MHEPNPPSAGPEADHEIRRIAKAALYDFLLNLILAGMKGGPAYFSNCLAVTAGAIDSATDAVASMVLFAGLKLATREDFAKKGPGDVLSNAEA